MHQTFHYFESFHKLRRYWNLAWRQSRLYESDEISDCIDTFWNMFCRMNLATPHQLVYRSIGWTCSTNTTESWNKTFCFSFWTWEIWWLPSKLKRCNKRAKIWNTFLSVSITNRFERWDKKSCSIFLLR